MPDKKPFKCEITSMTKDGLVTWIVDGKVYVYMIDAAKHPLLKRLVEMKAPGKAFNICKRQGQRMFDVEDEIENVSNPIKRYHLGPVRMFLGYNKRDEPCILLDTKASGGVVTIQVVGRNDLERLYKHLGTLLKGG